MLTNLPSIMRGIPGHQHVSRVLRWNCMIRAFFLLLLCRPLLYYNLYVGYEQVLWYSNVIDDWERKVLPVTRIRCRGCMVGLPAVVALLTMVACLEYWTCILIRHLYWQFGKEGLPYRRVSTLWLRDRRFFADAVWIAAINLHSWMGYWAGIMMRQYCSESVKEGFTFRLNFTLELVYTKTSFLHGILVR